MFSKAKLHFWTWTRVKTARLYLTVDLRLPKKHPPRPSSFKVKVSPTLQKLRPVMDLLDQIRSDYEHFPKDQSFHLYADDVYFKDPLNEFRGVKRYQEMIGFMEQWFQQVNPGPPRHPLQHPPAHRHPLDPELGRPRPLETGYEHPRSQRVRD